MNTTFADPLQDHGDICESCRKFWEAQGQEPKTLRYLRDDVGEVVTTGTRGYVASYDENDSLLLNIDYDWDDDDRNIPVVICPHCDGDVLIRLHKL